MCAISARTSRAAIHNFSAFHHRGRKGSVDCSCLQICLIQTTVCFPHCRILNKHTSSWEIWRGGGGSHSHHLLSICLLGMWGVQKRLTDLGHVYAPAFRSANLCGGALLGLSLTLCTFMPAAKWYVDVLFYSQGSIRWSVFVMLSSQLPCSVFLVLKKNKSWRIHIAKCTITANVCTSPFFPLTLSLTQHWSNTFCFPTSPTIRMNISKYLDVPLRDQFLPQLYHLPPNGAIWSTTLLHGKASPGFITCQSQFSRHWLRTSHYC